MNPPPSIHESIQKAIDDYGVEQYRKWLRMSLCDCYPLGHHKYPCTNHGDRHEDAEFYKNRTKSIARKFKFTANPTISERHAALAFIETQAVRETIERIRQREGPVLDFQI